MNGRGYDNKKVMLVYWLALMLVSLLVACGDEMPALCDEVEDYDTALFMESSEGTIRWEASFSGSDRKGMLTQMTPDGTVFQKEEYVIKDGTWYGRELIDTGREMDGPDEWKIVTTDEKHLAIDAGLHCFEVLAGPFEPRDASDDYPDYTTTEERDGLRVTDEYWVDSAGRPTRVRRTTISEKDLSMKITYSGFSEPNIITAPDLP